MIRDIKLMDYLPAFLQVFKELHLIIEAETPEFQQAMDDSEKIKDNGFILSADSDGLERFENLLGIYSTDDMDLETRRAIVLDQWGKKENYTYESLLEKIEAIAGKGNYEVVPDFDNYKISITVRLTSRGQVDEFNKLIAYIMPANLLVVASNNILTSAGISESVGVVFETGKTINI